MNISGIREPEIFQSDSESTDVENKLSQLPTESSSDSNEDCINDSQSSEQALVEQNQTFIHENEGHRIPTEHAENENCNCPPEDDSMESVGSEKNTKLCNVETTDDDSENEKSPKNLRSKRQRPLSLVETVACKISVDEPCPQSSQSSSESSSDISSSQSSQSSHSSNY